MTNLTTSIKHFASPNRAPGPTCTEATKRRASHKPLLLLAVLDLVNRLLFRVMQSGEVCHWIGLSNQR